MAYTSDLILYTGDWDTDVVEDFAVYYLDAMSAYWKKGVLNKVPVRQSILDLPEVQAQPNLVKATKEWLPVGKSLTQLAGEPFPRSTRSTGDRPSPSGPSRSSRQRAVASRPFGPCRTASRRSCDPRVI